MLAQRFDCVIVPGKLGFGQGRMDLVVTNLMEKHRRSTFPAPKFRDEMVEALRDVRRNRTVTERTNGRIAHG